jgi:hypothetical protein
MGEVRIPHKQVKLANEQAREQARSKIKVGRCIQRLQDCVDGTYEMTSQQIKAAEILLNKTLPTLTSADIKKEVTVDSKDITADLISKIAKLNSSVGIKIEGSKAIVSTSEEITEAEFVEEDNAS